MPAAILTKYLAPTNHTDARISVSWGDGNRCRIVVIWNSSLGIADNHDAAMRVFLADRRMGGTWARGAITPGFAYCLTPATRTHTGKGAPTKVRIVA